MLRTIGDLPGFGRGKSSLFCTFLTEKRRKGGLSPPRFPHKTGSKPGGNSLRRVIPHWSTGSSLRRVIPFLPKIAYRRRALCASVFPLPQAKRRALCASLYPNLRVYPGWCTYSGVYPGWCIYSGVYPGGIPRTVTYRGVLQGVYHGVP